MPLKIEAREITINRTNVLIKKGHPIPDEGRLCVDHSFAGEGGDT